MSLIASLNIIISILGFCFFYGISRDMKNPAVIYNLLWLIVISLLQINTMEWYELSVNTYVVSSLGLFMFNLGALFSMGISISRKRTTNHIDYQLDDNNGIKTRRLLSIQILLLVITLPMLIKAITFIGIYGWHDMRTIYANGIEYGYMTAGQRLFYIHFVIFPLIQTCFYVQSVLWGKGLVPFWHVLISIINIIFVIIITVGRWDLAYVFIALFFSYQLNLKRKALSKVEQDRLKKQNRKIKYILILVVILLSWATVLRHDIESNMFENVINVVTQYFSSGMALLNVMLENVSQSGLDTYHWGSATLAGFLKTISFIMQLITLGHFSFSVPDVQEYAGQFHAVSPAENMNAYVTIYYYFMRDFGYLGLIVFTFIFAFICVNIYKNLKINPSLFNQIAYLHMISILFFSTLWWEPIRMEVVAKILHNFWLLPFIGIKFKGKVNENILQENRTYERER